MSTICTDNYISDNIFIRDNKMYYNGKNKEIKITPKNWHKYLEEYGWLKLHLKWIKRLNIFLNKSKELEEPGKRKNSLFGVLDCGGSGDCFFACVCQSLNYEQDILSQYDVKSIRIMLADSIKSECFTPIIENYRILKDLGEFHDEWDPYLVQTLEDLKEEIKKEGSNFLADYIILQLFQELFNVNIIILNSTQKTDYIYNNIFKLYNTGIRYCKDKKTIILSYEDEEHFRLIGYLRNNMMITLFNDKTLPEEIKYLITNDFNF